MPESETTTAQRGPWWQWLAPWTAPSSAAAMPWFGLAPQQLTQPINPGWTFGNIVSVTNVNSTAPDVERTIVERHSYGRQIGRMMDALAALVETMPPGKRGDERITEFVEVAREVGRIKERAQTSRAARLRAELEQLRRDDPRAWAELKRVFAGR